MSSQVTKNAKDLANCGGEVASLPSEKLLNESIILLKGLADLTRLKILCLIRGNEVCVHDIVEVLDISQSGVSHQLRILRDARLVSSRKQGRHVFYQLADEHIEQLLKNTLTHGSETV
ncbi:MAG: helix-turn-helix transcriptional regulator [Trueperaceae bacterium]|nr:helix-turn-helix transcriptional regulator [Trueperaceae bacterium]